MASGLYNRWKANIMNKVVDMEADTINVALYDSSHIFTATDTVYTTTNELPALGNYTQGGAALTGKTVTEGSSSKWTADNLSWTSATFKASHAVIYDVTASNNLIASLDFGAEKEVSAGTFLIQWDNAGIILIA